MLFLKKTTAARNDVRAYRAHMYEKRLTQYKLEWLQKRGEWKVIVHGREPSNDGTKTDLCGIVSRVITWHGHLTKTMVSHEIISEAERRQAIEDLHFLIILDRTFL